MVDRTLVLRKIAELDTYLGQLQEYSKMPLGQYVQDWKSQRIVERTLQMAFEACSDIAGHIISDQGLRLPGSYSEAFAILAESAILTEDISSTMQQMAKFRNVVVHGYDKIDATIVIEILRNRLSDFSAYQEQVLDFLDSADQT